jgi:hypothetical protein
MSDDLISSGTMFSTERRIMSQCFPQTVIARKDEKGINSCGAKKALKKGFNFL